VGQTFLPAKNTAGNNACPTDAADTAKGIAAIVRGFSHLGWLCVKASLLVAVAAAAGAGLYYYNHLNDEIRLRVRDKIAAHYAGLTVEVRSALLVDGEGIEIRGITISDPNLEGPAAELAYFDEIVLTCRTELQEFLAGQPHIERVRVRRPRIRATRLADGGWSAARLLPCPKFGKHRVETTIENGVVEVIDTARPNSPTFTLREVNVQLNPLIEEHAEGDEPVRFEGTLAGDYFQRVTFGGRIEAGGAGCRVEGAIDRLDMSPELRAALPAELANRIAPLASLRATCGLKFAVNHRPDQPQPWEFGINGQILHGRFDHPRLPQPLTELAAEFRVDNGGVIVNSLTAAFGEAQIQCIGQLYGFAPGAPFFVEATAEKLLVGRSWERILSPELVETWKKILPAGEVDARLKLSFDGTVWQPDVLITCRNVSFTYHKFPYRVDRGRGTVTLKDDHLSLNLKAQGAGREILIKGEIDAPSPDFTGWVEVSGSHLAIEPRIVEALQERPQQILRALNPSGTFSFYTKIHRADPRERPHQKLTLALDHCSIRYDRFNYPISSIKGTVVMEDGRWWSDDLEGVNDTGRIYCRATLQPTREGPKLALYFTGLGITLEDELRDALPAPVQKVWRDLRPQGSVNLRADVGYITGRKTPDIQVYIDRIDEQASLEPVAFPYRLERLRGDGQQPVFSFDSLANRVDFPLVRAQHGRTELSARGYCHYDDGGGWLLRFERLTADGMRADDGDLLAALPPGLKKVVTLLNPTGVINLDGRLDLWPSGLPESPLQSAWNLDFNVEQTSIQAGVLLENISGTVNLRGGHDGRQLHSAGELKLDNLTFKDFQFRSVLGPLWVDDARIILGSRAEHSQPNRLPRPLTARLYGGTVQSDIEVNFGETPQYLLRATLTDGDLDVFAREQLPGKQRLSGKVGAGLVLTGSGAGLHSMSGGGEIHLSDADIYELPFMVRLLSILSVRMPDKAGFTNSQVGFAITGEVLELKKIEFSSDAISLVGSGEMNLNCDVQATLAAIVGRSDWQLQMFKNMMGQASKQFMQIRVDGNLADPQIHREAFPAFNQALEQLQAGMQPRVQPLPAPQAVRPAGGRR
jgi:hypothetical protein